MPADFSLLRKSYAPQKTITNGTVRSNKSNTKFKQELEKTWSLERRLETWAKNDKNCNKSENGKPKPTVEKTNAEIIREAMQSDAAKNFIFSK